MHLSCLLYVKILFNKINYTRTMQNKKINHLYQYRGLLSTLTIFVKGHYKKHTHAYKSNP